MKTGRNEPCPCGSGKKYKKCCYFNEQDTQSNSADNVDNDDLLLESMMNLRKRILKSKPHIKEYYKIRSMHTEIITSMVNYHEDGKFKHTVISDFNPQTRRSNTLNLINSEFDMGTREGSQAFYDMLVYKCAPNMNCITEDFIQKHRYKKPEKTEFLNSMLNSALGLFEITNVDLNEGYAYLKNVFNGEEYKVTDIGLSGNSNYDKFYLYTRIITYQGISINTGLSLIFYKDDNFIKNHIHSHKNDYNPNGEFLRFTQLYNRFSEYPNNVGVAPVRFR